MKSADKGSGLGPNSIVTFSSTRSSAAAQLVGSHPTRLGRNGCGSHPPEPHRERRELGRVSCGHPSGSTSVVQRTGPPSPGILVFDQPSQAHYPPEADQSDGVDGLQDADRRAVHNLFEFMHSASESVGDGFQLIVLDHAHLDDDWFNFSIVEEWRGDAALVPGEWIESS